MPYGGSVFIEKEECVSHITKRMGSGLRETVRSYKGMFLLLIVLFFLKSGTQ